VGGAQGEASGAQQGLLNAALGAVTGVNHQTYMSMTLAVLLIAVNGQQNLLMLFSSWLSHRREMARIRRDTETIGVNVRTCEGVKGVGAGTAECGP
jgi:hypothetical protein